jgi:hypothetical protein
MRFSRRAHQNYESIAFAADRVKTRLIEIEHYPSDHGLRGVLGRAHAPHAFSIDFDISCILGAAGIGKIEQNPVGMNSELRRGSHRCAKRNLYAHAGLDRLRGHAFHRDLCRRGLRHHIG